MSAVALDTSRSVAEPSAIGRRIAAAAVVLYAVVTLIPLVWIFLTGFKTPPDSIAYPPKVVFDPSLVTEGLIEDRWRRATEPATLEVSRRIYSRAAMKALAGLRAPVDAFFDKVLVNAPEEHLRRNRLLLLSRFKEALSAVADFSRIEG